MKALLDQLRGGDRRSIGAVPQVVQQVLAEPQLFAAVFDGISDADSLIRMRCADAAEKITLVRPDLLAPYTRRLIALAQAAEQQEVRWHIAQMLSRVALTKAQRQRVVGMMDDYLDDASHIVQVCAMQLLADIAARDSGLRAPIVARLEQLTRKGSPAVKSRGKRLLAQLSQSDKGA